MYQAIGLPASLHNETDVYDTISKYNYERKYFNGYFKIWQVPNTNSLKYWVWLITVLYYVIADQNTYTGTVPYGSLNLEYIYFYTSYIEWRITYPVYIPVHQFSDKSNFIYNSYIG